MEFQHTPVLYDEVMEWMQVRENGIYVDGTLGGGGHTEGMLRSAPGVTVYGIDRDTEAIAAATARLTAFPGFHALHGNFHDGAELLKAQGIEKVQGVLLDLGVSSHQLDEGERGFSYHQDAPLDMRMDQSQGLTAAELLNTWPEKEIARILRDYSEEKWAARIAAIICERRAKSPLATTGDLVACVDAAIPKAVRRRDDGHPARRTFQAVRIAVNDELDPLEKALEDFADLLEPGGRLLVITFHSLEDRIVKRTMQRLQHPCICPPSFPVCVCGRRQKVRVLGGGAIKPGKAEVERNVRARSAILRVCERVEEDG